MKKTRKYSIHPSLQRDVPDVLPIFQHPWMIRCVNVFLGIQTKLFRIKNGQDVDFEAVRITKSNDRTRPAMLIAPKGLVGQAPLLIYYHGGGFALACSSLQLAMCVRYAKEACCKVLLVDYRLTPSWPWPHGFNDSYNALEWAIESASSIGIDSENVVVGGDSAGGALAAGVAQKAIDCNLRLKGQLLIYPMLDSRCSSRSAAAYSDTPFWTSQVNRQAWKMYLKPFDLLDPPKYSSPLHGHSLEGIAPAYLEIAEFDPLHDEGIEYAQRMLSQGVSVEINDTKGTFHGFEFISGSPLVGQVVERRLSFLRSAFLRTKDRGQL